MSVIRAPVPGVLPLELWDVSVDDGPLYLVPPARLPAAVVDLVRRLQAGTARRRLATTPLPSRPVERVVLAGGGPVVEVAAALDASFQPTCNPTPSTTHVTSIAVEVLEDPLYAGTRGLAALLAAHTETADAKHPLLVDVGQTAIKQRWQGVSRRRPRDGRAPFEHLVRHPAARELARRHTLAFLADALRAPQQGPDGRPDAVGLALPCEVRDTTLAGCSYAWDDDDSTFLPALVAAAGLPDATPVLVVNDAEAAALCCQAERPDRRRTLVLTLGLGVGASELLPSNADA